MLLIRLTYLGKLLFAALSMSSLSNVTAQQFRQAAGLKHKIEELKKQLADIVGSSAAKAASTAPRANKIRRKMSTVTRAKIAAAQHKRWAKVAAAKTQLTVSRPKFRPGKGLKDAVN